MTEGEARELARQYATAYGVPWAGVSGVRRTRQGWWFRVLCYTFEVDTGGRGPAEVMVNVRLGRVVRCEFRPADPSAFLVPLWAAWPGQGPTALGWRMGVGEWYRAAWAQWFAGLPPDRRAAYRERFPEPEHDGWQGFYERAA